MNEKKIKRILNEYKEVAVSDTVRASLCWSNTFTVLRWCVVKTEACKIPKWQFWRVRFAKCSMYGPFPSRNQAVKFANPV